jgi:hypothetical protein
MKIENKLHADTLAQMLMKMAGRKKASRIFLFYSDRGHIFHVLF